MSDTRVDERRNRARHRLHRASTKKDSLPVEFRSAIRLRPLNNKKERDDHIVVEIPRTRHEVRHSGTYPYVVLRPQPRSEHASGPTNANNMPFASPETAARTYHNNNQEMEFHFNKVFGEHATQDGEIFAEIGRPMSLAAMEPLFSDRAIRRSHVNIAVGTAGSGKTYTCFGSCAQSLKRKVSSDGVLPRMTDSLFGQYQRLASMKKPNSRDKSRVFVVKISAFQVNQPKNPKNSSGEAGKLYDLLQHATRPSQAGQEQQRPPFERHSSGTASESSGQSPRSGSLGSLEKTLYIDQNPLTHDFRVANAQIRQCRSSEEAREALQDIVVGIRKASSRRHECHVLVQIEPVLVDEKSGDTVRRGGKIAFLDMASYVDRSRTKQRNCFVSNRLKDSMPNRCDAHAAVVHCLRSILFNELLRQGKDPTAAESDNVSEITMETKLLGGKSHSKKPLPRQVPFLQHKITMLLQPYFSSNHSDRAVVSVMLNTSPGHREYIEKKELMAEIQSLWSPFHRSWTHANTGVEGLSERNHERDRQKKRESATSCSIKEELLRCKPLLPGALSKTKKNDPSDLDQSVTHSCSDSADEFSLPPPVAPPAPSLRPAEDLIRRASAPVEDEGVSYERVVIPMERTAISDFPGVAVMAGKPPPVSHDFVSEVSESPSSAKSIEEYPHSSTNDRKTRKSKSRYPSRRSKSRDKSPHKKNHRSGSRHDRTSPHAINIDKSGKTKWSRTVEITTTTVESSDDPLPDSPEKPLRTSTETAESEVSELRGENDNLKNEMEDLKRQNESLQLQLERLKISKTTKSVSWSSDSDQDERDPPPRPSSRPVVHAKSTPATRLMGSPLLREQMARFHTAPASGSGSRYQTSGFPSMTTASRGTNGFQLRDPRKANGTHSGWNH